MIDSLAANGNVLFSPLPPNFMHGNGTAVATFRDMSISRICFNARCICGFLSPHRVDSELVRNHHAVIWKLKCPLISPIFQLLSSIIIVNMLYSGRNALQRSIYKSRPFSRSLPLLIPHRLQIHQVHRTSSAPSNTSTQSKQPRTITTSNPEPIAKMVTGPLVEMLARNT
jgi:hypothetical protein